MGSRFVVERGRDEAWWGKQIRGGTRTGGSLVGSCSALSEENFRTVDCSCDLR